MEYTPRKHKMQNLCVLWSGQERLLAVLAIAARWPPAARVKAPARPLPPPTHQRRARRSHQVRDPPASPAATGPRSGRDDDEEPSATWPQVAAARRVASAFFHSYIAYLYGRAPARQSQRRRPGSSPQLAQGHATITPAERASHPRLTRLAVASAGPPVSVIAIAFVDVDHRRPAAPHRNARATPPQLARSRSRRVVARAPLGTARRAPVLSIFVAATAIAVIAAITANACTNPTSGTGDQPSPAAIHDIPAQLLPIYEQVGTQYDIPWELLAGIGTEECDQGRLRDPACTIQPGATGPGTANPAGASGLMQIGIGGAAGDSYDQLRQYLPNPALGPHDPTTAVQLAALVLTKDKHAPTGQPIDAYLPYARAYNGTGPAADAYAARVIADAHRYQGNQQTAFVGASTGCASAPSSAGYVNPFARAQVTPSRIDQGVDYSGTGPIDAIGPGRVTLVSTTDTGWGNGNGWISYQLTAGAYAGDYIYIAEGITPTVHQGQAIAAGQQIGSFNGHSIEIGFALGQGDLALAHGVYHEGADTAAGRAMNAILAALGAPPGHRDMSSCQGPCPVIAGPQPTRNNSITSSNVIPAQA